MESRCRLCAENSTELVHLFEDIHYINLSVRIMDLFKIKISLGDNLPTTVCYFCCEMVDKIWDFNERVQKSQDLLSHLLTSALPIHIDFEGDKACIEDSQAHQTSTAPQPQSAAQTQILSIHEDLQIQDKLFIVQKEESDNVSGDNKLHKSKTRKFIKKKVMQSLSDLLPELAGIETNEDGSVIPKVHLLGWESYLWVCSDCQQNVPNSEDLRDHYATVHRQAAKYSCADCAKVYTKYSTFLTHVRVHRLHFRFCCDVCYKWFPNVDSHEKHRAHHTEERLHSCTTCGKRFRMQSALLVHTRSHLPTELKNKHQCDQCPKRFGTKPNLMAHKRIHAGVRDYTCDQCGKSFVQKGNLDNHLLIHTAVRPFSCSVCGKAFKTHVRLRKHGSIHSGLKPHQCDVCGRQFRERGTLKEHHRIHTGAMPFTCEFCGKSFRFKGVLTTHRRQHTGERPYSCFECQHHFTNWPNYNKHMKRRHGINTSVTVRKPQTIPPTGMPHRNPPGTVLAPPQSVTVPDTFIEPAGTFYPVLSLYNLSEELLQQRV